MKKTTPKKSHVGILQAAVAVVRDSLESSGSSYRMSDFVAAIRITLQQRNLKAKTVLVAMKTWLDQQLIKFNNKYLTVTPKGAKQIFQMMPS
jgi:hypothetical protein